MPTSDAIPRRLPVSLFAAACLLLAGCPDRQAAVRTTAEVEPEDPLAGLRETLRRGRDLESCKAAVAQLRDLARRGDQKVPALTDAERAALTSQAHLTPDELKEVAQDDFTGLDAVYLEECLMLHDAVRSLDLDWADTPAAELERARLAFAWAVRQAWLKPGLGRMPSSAVLRRGSAAAAERVGLALAMFQAVGLDGCAVGEKSDGGSPQAWAVGARVGKDVYLFDVHNGRPVAGPGGKGVATLAQARATPELLAPVAAGLTPPGDARALAGRAEAYVSPPLSALAARMRFAESALRFTPPLRLAVSLTELQKRFADAAVTTTVWNPAAVRELVDAGTPMRALAYFVPPPDGLDRNASTIGMFVRDLVPLDRQPKAISEEMLAGDSGNRLRQHFAARFIAFHMEAGRPRDLVIRGRFDEATRALVDMTTEIARTQDRAAAEGALEADAERWATEMRSAYVQMLRLQRDAQSGAAAAEAQAKVDALMRTSGKINALIERAAAEPAAMAATYQLALCKHEQAERQSRRSPATAKDAWQDAAGWWNQYLAKYGSQKWVPAGQVAHARVLLAECQAKK